MRPTTQHLRSLRRSWGATPGPCRVVEGRIGSAIRLGSLRKRVTKGGSAREATGDSDRRAAAGGGFQVLTTATDWLVNRSEPALDPDEWQMGHTVNAKATTIIVSAVCADVTL